jgi:hypothetical protein
MPRQYGAGYEHAFGVQRHAHRELKVLAEAAGRKLKKRRRRKKKKMFL